MVQNTKQHPFLIHAGSVYIILILQCTRECIGCCTQFSLELTHPSTLLCLQVGAPTHAVEGVLKDTDMAGSIYGPMSQVCVWGGGGEVRAMIDTMFCRCVRGCVRACVRVCVRTYVRACLCVRISSMAQAAAKVCGSLFFSVSPTEVQMLVTKARKYKF